MIKKIAVTVVILFCIVLFWLHSENRYRKAVRPPDGATNLTVFLRLRPDVEKIQSFTHSGKTYLEVFGRATNVGLSLPSGPPVYVFDESGTLVDWAADLGEASAFNNKWASFSNAIPTTIEEAKALINHK